MGPDGKPGHDRLRDVAFPATDLDQQAGSRILLGSVVSGLGGVVVLTSLKRERAVAAPRV